LTNNSASLTTMANPAVAIPARTVPTLTLKALGSRTVGGTISGEATLAGGSVVTGVITLSVYGPGDATCAHALATTTLAVSGDGIYGSEPFTPRALGTYRWVAGYGGDAENAPVVTSCDAPAAAITVGAALAPPSNAFTLTAAKVDAKGRIRVVVKCPGPGRFDAVATVRVRIAGKKHQQLLRYGSRALWAPRAGRFTLVVSPGGRANALRRRHSTLRVTLVVTFTPRGGKGRTRTVHATVRGTRP
jgi:hypothetical protein